MHTLSHLSHIFSRGLIILEIVGCQLGLLLLGRLWLGRSRQRFSLAKSGFWFLVFGFWFIPCKIATASPPHFSWTLGK